MADCVALRGFTAWDPRGHGLDRYAALGLCGRRGRGGAVPSAAGGSAWVASRLTTRLTAAYGMAYGDVHISFIQRSWGFLVRCWAPNVTIPGGLLTYTSFAEVKLEQIKRQHLLSVMTGEIEYFY